jgi:hypothetical protein
MGGASVNLRLKMWCWQMLLCFDQLTGCWIRGCYFIWFGGECPNADETISSFVGRKSEAGKRWARIAERIIDSIMGAGHCRRSIENLTR